ncbi:MAG: hypothetical protein AAGJ32_05735 [Pseudomonadota bacterium]
MFDQNDLRAAVDSGVLTRDQARRLEGFLEARSGGASAGDPETLRFLANFNDIFITTGLVLLVSGVLLLTGLMGFGSTGGGSPAFAAAVTLLPAAGVSWLLSEYFCTRRRLLLPSMALCAMFTLFIGLTATAITGQDRTSQLQSIFGIWNAAGSVGMIGAGAAAAAAIAYFLRFRLPFSLFILALSLASMAYAGISVFGDIGLVIGGGLSVIIGALTLALAISLDMTDPKRATRKADYAFWLHLAAAPQIIFGLRLVISGSGAGSQSYQEALILLVALIGFALLSLALNRRALIASSLLSYGLALQVLVSSSVDGPLQTTIVTLLLLGGAVVLLGSGWSTARRAVLSLFPRHGIYARLFPPEPA